MKLPLLAILLAAMFGGCSATGTTNARDFIDATRATGQVLATQPGTEKTGAALVKAADQAAPVADKVDALKASVDQLANKNATLADRVDALQGAVTSGAAITHAVAPGTPADRYGELALAIVGLAGMWMHSRNTKTAIQTPGTTIAPEAKG